MQLKSFILISLITIGLSHVIHAQDTHISSTGDVAVLLELADTTSDPTIAREAANKALFISEDQGNLEGKVDAYLMIGNLNLRSGNFAGAIKNASRANEISVNSNYKVGKPGIIHHIMSSGLEGIGAFKDAIEHRKKAMTWQLENNPEYSKGRKYYFSLSKIGLLFMTLEDYDSAKIYFNQALIQSKNIQSPELLGGMFNNIGFVHYKLGEVDSAQLYFHSALKSFNEIELMSDRSSFMTSLVKGNLASCFKDDSPLKESYYLEDIEGSTQFGDFGNAIHSSIEFANFLVRKKRYYEAESVLLDAKELIPLLTHSKRESQIELSQTFTHLYIQSGNTEKAASYFKEFMTILREEKSSASIQKLIEAHSTFKLSKIESELKIEQIEGEKKIAEINTLNKENELTKLRYGTYISIAAFAVIILVLIVLRIKSNSARKEREKDLKNRLLKLELKYNNERLNQSVLSVSRKKDFAEELMERAGKIENIDRHSLNSLRFFVLNELQIDDSILDKEKEIHEVGADLIAQLKDQFSNLSDSDIQLLSFIKMKLTNKQIGEIKNITQASVKIAKNRLRKKLNLPSGSNFFDHLSF